MDQLDHCAGSVISGCCRHRVAVTLLLAVLAMFVFQATASAHPDVPRKYRGGPRGVTVDGVTGTDPIGGACLRRDYVQNPNPAPASCSDPAHFPSNGPDMSRNQSNASRGCIYREFARDCRRPAIVDIDWCKANMGWAYSKPDCGLSLDEYDHNWGPSGTGACSRAIPICTWVTATHIRQCEFSDCFPEYGGVFTGSTQYEWRCGVLPYNAVEPWCHAVRWAPAGARDLDMNGGGQILQPTSTTNNAGFRAHPFYESHHYFYGVAQAQDGWAHAFQYCGYWNSALTPMPRSTDFTWGYQKGDCSFPSGAGYISTAFEGTQGNCTCPYAYTGDGFQRDGTGPFRPDYEPWRPALGGIWRRTTSATPFRTVNHFIIEDPSQAQKGLYAWYSDPDGQQWPYEGLAPAAGQSRLTAVVQRIGGGYNWSGTKSGIREGGAWLDLSNRVVRSEPFSRFSVMPGGGTTYTPGSTPDYLPNGTYSWNAFGTDHHGLDGPPSRSGFFTVYTPGPRQCDLFTFKYLCTLTVGTRGRPGPDISYYDDTGPDGFSSPPQPVSTAGGPNIFEYDLMNSTSNTVGTDAASCGEHLKNPAGALPPQELNAVMKVRLNLSRFDVNNNGAKARSSMRGIFPVGQRESDPTYLEGLNCIQ